MLGEGMCSWLCQGSESARGLAETGWVLGGVGVGEVGWGHRKRWIRSGWTDNLLGGQTPCLEAALDGQTVAMLGGSHGQAPCLVDRQALCLEDRLTAWGHSLFQS